MSNELKKLVTCPYFKKKPQSCSLKLNIDQI